MASQDIIVIGASAGGVEALRVLVRHLPPDLPATLFVVVHIGQRASVLPQILTESGRLPAIHPTDRQQIQKGMIYVAPPGQHLLIEQGHVHLSCGPKENRTRPAINPLFRSAALAYGSRVAGVILTGLLDDGVSGLWDVKRHGGVAIVQDPKEAVYPSMPNTAIEHVRVDHIVKLSEMPSLLFNLSVSEHVTTQAEAQSMSRTVSDITCPDCGGTLWEEQKGSITDYVCRVGHAYSILGLADHHKDTQEKALWAAVVALHEGATIHERLSPQVGGWHKEQAARKREQAAILKDMITNLSVNETVHQLDSPSSNGDSEFHRT